ncbi:hypothetical protein ABT093_03375 [Kitasatospora sp. NPDC002551]|uniref:aromatic-ring hydroxylase C-terminal domain-containing protein n=1 Tax=Kitasatospora sp. NPDC002551 TaxID=3154539 RepID=UPI00331877B7
MPGGRLPHLRLAEGPGAASTLDLVGSGFTLLTPAPDAAAAAGLPVIPRPVPVDAPRWARLSGVPATGAVLVRPDGHLAWRAPHPPADAAALLGVLRRILSADGAAPPRR